MAQQKITPFLWLESRAEEAAKFYVSLFPDSAIISTTPGPDGAPWVVEFKLMGNHYMAFNGGPHFKLTEAFSLSVDCKTQAEVDHYWDKLSEGSSTSQCGWLKDRFGLFWQVVPSVLPELLGSPDREKAGRVMNAMMGMTKLDIQALQSAAEGK